MTTTLPVPDWVFNPDDNSYLSRDGRWFVRKVAGENQLWHLIDQRNPACTLSGGCYPDPQQAMAVALAKDSIDQQPSAEEELDDYIKRTKITDPQFALDLAIGEVEDQLYTDMRQMYPNGDRTTQAQWASDMAPCIYRYIKNAQEGRRGD